MLLMTGRYYIKNVNIKYVEHFERNSFVTSFGEVHTTLSNVSPTKSRKSTGHRLYSFLGTYVD